MATQITATLPGLDFPKEVDYPTQEDWAAFSAAAELNFGILGGSWSEQMQLWKTEANAMSTELNNNADLAQSIANYQGDWVSQGYTLGQTVSVSGIYYICKLTHATAQNPTTAGSLYWNLVIGNWNLKVDKVISTDNAIARFSGTTGEIQNSSVIIDDNGNVGIGNPTISLPSTAGSKITAFSKHINVGNTSYLGFDTVRTSAGSTHESSEERIRKVIDSTEMGYIGFGNNNVKLGTSSGDKVIIDDNGNVGIGTVDVYGKLGIAGQVGINCGGSQALSARGLQFFIDGIKHGNLSIDNYDNLLYIGGGLGYGTGSGGTVTQLTSKSTAVTLNKPTGQIITSNSSLAAGATVGFTLNNSLLTGNDTVNVIVRGGGSSGAYQAACTFCVDGAVNITFKNLDAVSRTDAVAINFTVIKGANS